MSKEVTMLFSSFFFKIQNNCKAASRSWGGPDLPSAQPGWPTPASAETGYERGPGELHHEPPT